MGFRDDCYDDDDDDDDDAALENEKKTREINKKKTTTRCSKDGRTHTNHFLSFFFWWLSGEPENKSVCLSRKTRNNETSFRLFFLVPIFILSLFVFFGTLLLERELICPAV